MIGSPKLSIWTAYYSFLENRHPEDTEVPYYVCSPEQNQKKISSDGVNGHDESR